MIEMNVFRVLGDVSHTASKCILVWAIHSNRSAEGVSLITQVLYVLVFVTRYLDLFWVPPGVSWWNFVLKNFYIFSSLYIILLMMRVYARTREREKSWRLGAYCLGGSIMLTPVVVLINLTKQGTDFSDILWTFSLILESVCVIPQLLLLRQTTVPTVIDSFYLLTLGSYRGFYILNWIVRAAGSEHHFEWRAVVFGIIQTALYVDFAWVYWTRQRVKLRNGGVVDSDDLRRGFLVSRLLGRGDATMDEEDLGVEGREEVNAVPTPRRVGRWGPRGISVSADEGVMNPPPRSKPKTQSGDSKAVDGGLASLMEDETEEISIPSKHTNGVANGTTNGREWRDEGGG